MKYLKPSERPPYTIKEAVEVLKKNLSATDIGYLRGLQWRALGDFNRIYGQSILDEFTARLINNYSHPPTVSLKIIQALWRDLNDQE